MSFLDELLTSTRARVKEARAAVPEEALDARAAALEAPRGFAAALDGDELAIIAEIKRASPLKGALNLDLDAGPLARAYAEGGAAAISVLTEPTLFKGSLEDLQQARVAGLPVLRKDFVIDPYQVLEARAWGADAVLLIVRVLGDELSEINRLVNSLGMDALVEIHDEAELDRALDVGADLIGINQRDLTTFEVDPQRTAKLAARVPEGPTLIALSGFGERSEIERLADEGVRAVLVGESLVTAADPAAKLRELRGVA